MGPKRAIRIIWMLGVLSLILVLPMSAACAAQAAKSRSGTTPFAVGTLRATLNNPGADLYGNFGLAVAQSGSGLGATIIVGAYGNNSRAGQAYIYVKGTSGWPTTPTATLSDPAATSGDYFGLSVAVSGDTAVVGAYDTNDTAGAAYIYVKKASGWPSTPTVTLSDPTATSNDEFGESVAVSGTTAVVGAWATNSESGAAYIYLKGSSGWPTKPTVTLSDPAATSDDYFGNAVAVSGHTAVIAAPGNKSFAGAVYVYVRRPSGWPTTPTAKLKDPSKTSGGSFGTVALDGSTAVVGASGTNGSVGSAYIYVKGSSGWPTTPTATLSDPAATSGDYFGVSVTVSGDTAVVGALGNNAASGAAYIYLKGSSGWPTTPTATLVDPGATSNDYFGSAVAVSGKTAIVGAYDSNDGKGAAYIYKA